MSNVDEIILDPFVSPWRPLDRPQVATSAAGAVSSPSTAQPYDFTARIADIERKLLAQALQANGHHQKRTAAFLGMTYHQLRSQLRKHGLIVRAARPDEDFAELH